MTAVHWSTCLTRAEAATVEEVPIPAGLVLPLDPQGRPSPVCSQCGVSARTAPSVGSDAAIVSFTFVGEQNEGFEGGVSIIVALDDGTLHRSYYDASVSLDDEDTELFEVHAYPLGFAWSEVLKVYVELLPAST